MSFALPETTRRWIDARVKSGSYDNTGAYLRDLIRRDQQAQAAKRLRELVGSDGASPTMSTSGYNESDTRAKPIDGPPSQPRARKWLIRCSSSSNARPNAGSAGARPST